MLGRPGGEKLKGFGDMLMQLPSENTLLRCQGSYADNEMIKDFIDTLIPYKTPELDPLDQSIENMESVADEIKNFIYPGDTYGFLEAVKFVISTGKAGSSYLQRHLHIGYNRAAGYMELLRARGVIQK
jgi:S-DNA-T family DNA segregation ATPase FtsK/SpoIIIE